MPSTGTPEPRNQTIIGPAHDARGESPWRRARLQRLRRHRAQRELGEQIAAWPTDDAAEAHREKEPSG